MCAAMLACACSTRQIADRHASHIVTAYSQLSNLTVSGTRIVCFTGRMGMHAGGKIMQTGQGAKQLVATLSTDTQRLHPVCSYVYICMNAGKLIVSSCCTSACHDLAGFPCMTADHGSPARSIEVYNALQCSNCTAGSCSHGQLRAASQQRCYSCLSGWPLATHAFRVQSLSVSTRAR